MVVKKKPSHSSKKKKTATKKITRKKSTTKKVANTKNKDTKTIKQSAKPKKEAPNVALTKKENAVFDSITAQKTALKKKVIKGSRYAIKQQRRAIPSITHLKDDVLESVKPRVSTKDYVKVIPVGGVEEIGRNMIVVEYGDDIIVMDAGIEFPTSDHPGIDYLIPNVSYLKKYKNLVRGIVISHGHLDHVGALPYVIEDIGNPPIYTTEFTAAFIRKKFQEFRHLPTPNIIEIKKGDRLKIGQEGLRLRFFGVEHAIPDSIGTVVETPFGDIIYPGDFKIARDRDNNPIEVDEYIELGKRKPLLLLLESTNIEKPGFSETDEEIAEGLEEVYKQAQGRIITATFSSQIERVVDIVRISEKLGRKVAILGYSLKTNLDLAKELNIFAPKKGTIIDVNQVNDYPPEKIMIVCTGGQGEENSALVRIVNKKDKRIKIQKGDTVVLSSSVVPGNERPVQMLKDNLARQGAKVYHYRTSKVHASGHAYRDEIAVMHKLLKPKFFIPVHGFYFNLTKHKELAMELGMPEENIVVPYHNGSIINVNKDKIWEDKESIPANFVAVDGLGVGDVKDVVLRDRNILAQDGIFAIFIIVDSALGKVKTSPDIISRGFIYLRENQELLREVRRIVRRTIESNIRLPEIDTAYLTEQVREEIGKFLWQHTKRRPMVLPVVVAV